MHNIWRFLCNIIHIWNRGTSLIYLTYNFLVPEVKLLTFIACWGLASPRSKAWSQFLTISSGTWWWGVSRVTVVGCLSIQYPVAIFCMWFTHSIISYSTIWYLKMCTGDWNKVYFSKCNKSKQHWFCFLYKKIDTTSNIFLM